VSYKYQWKTINDKKYFVNVFYMGQWICKNCKIIVFEDYTFEDGCGCSKSDLVMYQDWVVNEVDRLEAKNVVRKKC
jgi:hypothetical protein